MRGTISPGSRSGSWAASFTGSWTSAYECPTSAMWFDGVNDYVEIFSSGAFPYDKDDAFGFEFDLQTTVTGTTQVIFSNHNTSPLFTGVVMTVMPSGEIQLALNNTVSNRLNRATDASYADGVSRRIKVTYDGSSNADGVKFYVNGVKVASTIGENSLTASVATANPSRLGMRGADTTFPFLGVIRAFRLLNGTGGLEGSWVGTGTNNADWLDMSGNGNDGTVSGSPNAAISTDCGATWSEVT